MKLQIHAIHFDADPKLPEFIQKKLEKLETFYDGIINGEVFLRLDKSESSKIKDKIVEIKIHVPNAELFVKERGKSFEEATDIALEALKIQVKKYKSKRQGVQNKAIRNVQNAVDVEEEVDVDESL